MEINWDEGVKVQPILFHSRTWANGTEPPKQGVQMSGQFQPLTFLMLLQRTSYLILANVSPRLVTWSISTFLKPAQTLFTKHGPSPYLSGKKQAWEEGY